jgi:hypothetical protein
MKLFLIFLYCDVSVKSTVNLPNYKEITNEITNYYEIIIYKICNSKDLQINFEKNTISFLYRTQ